MSNIIFFSLVAFFLYIIILVIISLKIARRTSGGAFVTQKDNIDISNEIRKLELEIIITSDKDTGNASAETIVKNPAPGAVYSYAFYLVVNGERKSARWHDPSPKFEFVLTDDEEKREIVAFVRDEQNHTSSIKKLI